MLKTEDDYAEEGFSSPPYQEADGFEVGSSEEEEDDDQDFNCCAAIAECGLLCAVVSTCCCLCCIAGIVGIIYYVNGKTRAFVCELTRDPDCVDNMTYPPFDPTYGAILDSQGTLPICGSQKWAMCAHENMHTCGKSCCCDLGFMYSSTNCRCNPENWVDKNFDKKDVAKEMLSASCEGLTQVGLKVPKQWSGLWWMDGNPAPETVASFANALWESGPEACRKTKLSHYTQEEKNAGVLKDQFGDTTPCQGRMIVPFWQNRIWAMPDTKMGRLYEGVGTKANSNMEFVCGGSSPDNLTICKVGANTGPEGSAWYKTFQNTFAGAGGQAFNALANFAMVRVSADYWIRYSLSDGSYPYFLKRIVNCDGSPGKYWNLFMSNGTGVPPRDKDMYGHGGDTRDHVATVTDMQFVRWNQERPPEGSGWTCATNTGGTCGVMSCAGDRNAVCVNGACMCKPGDCSQGGVCSKGIPGCFKTTGGTCTTMRCDSWRNAQCIQGSCMCKEGQCAKDGACDSTV